MLSLTMSLAEQLTDIYLYSEDWHTEKLPLEEAIKYHQRLLDLGRIQVVIQSGKIIGYVESWRLSYEQWGKYVCDRDFCAYLENVTEGEVCHLSNIWIAPKHRKTNVLKILKMKFFAKNITAEWFTGNALRKKTQPIKVLKKMQFYKRHINKEQ